MKVLIVFELLDKELIRLRVVEKIRSFGDVCRIAANCYIVKTSSEPALLRDQLRRVWDFNDKKDILFVSQFLGNTKAAWNGLSETAGDWIREN